MEVVGYSYNADTFCPDCTIEYIRIIDPSITSEGISKILQGEVEFPDNEGNPIHPIFGTQEAGDTPDHCGDCGEFIDTSWSGDTVDYAVEALEQYVGGYFKQSEIRHGNPEVLDIWAENLGFCIIDEWQEAIRDMYEAIRNKEKKENAQ